MQYDETTKTVKQTEIAVIDDNWIQCNTCLGAVYLRKKNTFLVFGGYDVGSAEKRLDGIWRFDINVGKKWEKSDVTLPYKMDSFGWVLTNDERYVILFGGAVNGRNEWSDDILIWNMESMVITMSDIKCPEIGLFQSIIMPNDDIYLIRMFDGVGQWRINVKDLVVDDEVVVNGYLRMYDDTEYISLIPKEICDLIYYFYIRFTNIV